MNTPSEPNAAGWQRELRALVDEIFGSSAPYQFSEARVVFAAASACCAVFLLFCAVILLVAAFAIQSTWPAIAAVASSLALLLFVGGAGTMFMSYRLLRARAVDLETKARSRAGGGQQKN
jgi:hypothetical protein